MNYFKHLRNETGLTQDQFSKQFAIPLGTFRNWEQGLTTPPEYVQGMLYIMVHDYLDKPDQEENDFWND